MFSRTNSVCREMLPRSMLSCHGIKGRHPGNKEKFALRRSHRANKGQERAENRETRAICMLHDLLLSPPVKSATSRALKHYATARARSAPKFERAQSSVRRSRLHLVAKLEEHQTNLPLDSLTKSDP